MLNIDYLHLLLLELHYHVFMQLPQKRHFPPCVVFKYFPVSNFIILFTKENNFIAELTHPEDIVSYRRTGPSLVPQWNSGLLTKQNVPTILM